MNKRKESLPSPVKLKKTKDSVEAPATPNTLEEQRKRAKEWFDKEEKKKAEALEAENAKRAASPAKTPSKKTKTETRVEDNDEESVVSTRSASKRRSSISSVSDLGESTRTSRTPARVKKIDLPTIEEVAPAPPSAKKTPRAIVPKPEPVVIKKAPAKPAVAAEVSSPKKASPAVSPKVTPKAATPKQASPVPEPVSTSSSTPKNNNKPTPRTPRSSASNEHHPEVTALVESARAPPGAGNNLNPPNALLILLVQAYIFIGGVAYFNPKLGLGVFIAVNVLANLFLMNGGTKEE